MTDTYQPLSAVKIIDMSADIVFKDNVIVHDHSYPVITLTAEREAAVRPSGALPQYRF